MQAATAQYPSIPTDQAEAPRKISRAARRRVHARERRVRRTQRSLRAQLPTAW
ncbi:hypothetical protein [Kribbella sp. VKM Ac-2568]|jgi:hypothetical protein|uniref:hypothetical protein n=1 Tax=Kribbella sp. VKM Ac-2568 TaxID=2512219 RepID=UPI0010CED593|nr:hypothetical protein [Kribbella sp. VKM Ac-2568]TCM49187.1 hypothetical protein EV648_103456 [Kribbella sp. VKM Ac-2568]